MIPFRLHHLYQLIKELHTSPIGESNRVALYFKQHRSLGSKDRQWISSRIFAILRHQRLLEALILRENQSISPETLFEKVESGALHSIEDYQDIPWPVRYSISDDLADCLIKDYGEEKAQDLARCFLLESICSIRVNTLRISVEDLQKRLPYPSSPGSIAGSLRFDKRYPLICTPEFCRGLFEIQDESSQKVAFDIPITKKDCVLDFCAGAGGKSLIFAEKARHVVLHDSRKEILEEARQRFRRSRMKNFTLAPKLSRERFPIVVVDAPCSGSGVFRRHPEKKQSFSKKQLTTYVRVQKGILQEASRYVEPRGRLIYITCSILSEENTDHIKYMERFGWELEKMLTVPLEPVGGDGFFAAHFRKLS
ncbi:NOL1/NOP2/sun family protein [Chlamydia ibidis]|uniref:NOL1/NOP2/sun family protein n=2 Tax=Chlamydia ibidis TaxID=1405396 RepID=S7KEE4_9CHLA|nr:RsmB/NOP family class I SAM-dependent RNA methyltransferase [Chlamydia ibidis]EPP34576.1 NOL1/NOP2/sun family protein [Chlamydia ibidis]EQM62932.1 methyltransferase small domain protein [Chlamydia ibidis 10-1398/6]